MKIQKKKNWGGGGRGRGRVWGGGGGGQGGCDRRIEKFLGKFTKKKFRGGGTVWGGGGGVRVDVNEELKFLCKFKKIGGGGGVSGVGLGGGSGWMRTKN